MLQPLTISLPYPRLRATGGEEALATMTLTRRRTSTNAPPPPIPDSTTAPLAPGTHDPLPPGITGEEGGVGPHLSVLGITRQSRHTADGEAPGHPDVSNIRGPPHLGITPGLLLGGTPHVPRITGDRDLHTPGGTTPPPLGVPVGDSPGLPPGTITIPDPPDDSLVVP